MSEIYEGVVFCSDEQTARAAFATLASGVPLRLVHLAREFFGVYRVASRADALDESAIAQVAATLSDKVERAVALFYDNRCGVRVGVLYARGLRDREFGDADAWWVSCSEDGEPILHGARFRESELRPEEEYECVYSAIDAALDAIGASPQVSASLVKQAFCYNGSPNLAESGTQGT